MSAGFDTVSLQLHEFSVKKSAPLDIFPPVIHYDSGELKGDYALFMEGEKQINGQKAVHNGEFLNLDIKPVGCQVRGYVRFSLPKVQGQGLSNFYPVTPERMPLIMGLVQNELDVIGVVCDLKDAKITRLDMFTNLSTKSSFNDYETILLSMTASRKKHLPFRGEGYLWRNKNEQFCIYDKRVEMKQSNTLIPPGVPQNSIRVERRLMRSRKIRAELKTDLAAYLFDPDFTRKAQHNYKDAINKNLFDKQVKNMPFVSTGGLVTSLNLFKSTQGRTWFSKWIKFQCISTLVEKIPVSSLYDAFEIVSDNRMQVSRFRSQFKDIVYWAKNKGDYETLTESYDELRNSFDVALA